MSNRLMDLSWPLLMPPSPKVVLVSLADQADEAGVCWPAIPSLCQRTSLGRTAVIEAVKWLEARGAISVSRQGRCNRYVVTPDAFLDGLNSSGKRTNQSAGSVREADHSGVEIVRQADIDQSGSRTDQSARRTSIVRQADPNPQEPPITPRATQKKGRSSKWVDPVPMPEGVDPQTWADWLSLRKAKDAPVTVTVLREAAREAAKAGLTLTRFLEIWCARGSQGLQADWLKPNERGPPNGAKPSAAADFRGKTYDATPDDQLPIGLR